MRRWMKMAMLAALVCSAVTCSDDTSPVATTESATAPRTLAPVNAGDALTLPAHRHLVRVASGGRARWLLALEQDGGGGRYLGFYRSDDEARSWRYVAPIANLMRERADLVPVGMDVALVRSWEGPFLNSAVGRGVYFQWWRYDAAADNWTPTPAVTVFAPSAPSTGFYRAELARDSFGRLWVQAWRLNADGTNTALVSVSSDGGATFVPQPALATTTARGGGRFISLGNKLMMLWDQHSGVGTAQLRLRNDADPLAQWSPAQTAFGGGIYHGAALSAVADGRGGLHLVYKDKSFVLWYRHFDGAAFGAATLIENQGNWELQPAVSRVGDDLVLFYNRVINTNTNDEVRVRTFHAGVWSAPAVLDASVSFKGYPGTAEELPPTTASVPCFFSVTANAGVGGEEVEYSAPHAVAGAADLGVPDLAVPADLATPRDLSTTPPRDFATSGAPAPVLTHHNDPGRTGAQLGETRLTPSTVHGGSFGKLFTRAVDGQIYAQPLYAPGVAVAGAGTHDVVYVATENDSVYAFDAADPAASAPLWHVSLGTPPTANQVSSGNISPVVGITGTPVIDLASSTLYVAAKTTANGQFFYKLHALDIRSGAELHGGPVTIAGSVAGSGYDNVGGKVTFNALRELQRPALLLQNGVVYVAFGSHDDVDPYHGWVFAYDAQTLAQLGLYNDTPDGNEGGIWMSGGGPAGDGSGVYFMVGNGTFTTDGRNLGDSIVRLGRTAGVVDWFTPFDEAALSAQDLDLGSSSVVLIPGTNLLVGGGKQGVMYVVNRSAMGHFRSTDNGQIVQSFTGSKGFIFDPPVYWNGRLYVSGAGDRLRSYAFDGQKFNPTAVSTTTFAIPWKGGSIAISANGQTAGTGILWLVSPLSTPSQNIPVPGVMRAFDAGDLTHELWNSKMVTSDDLGSYTKFCPPMIANGRVYATTTSGAGALVVYGLLH